MVRVKRIRLGLLGSVVVGGLVLPTLAGPGAPGDEPGASLKREVIRVQRSEADFALWRRKAQLELASLEARVAAKKAEMARAEAEFRVGQFAPDLAILQALDRPVALHFAQETTLENAKRFIEEATRDAASGLPHGIPIYIDPQGLQDADRSMASTVTIDIEGVPLRTSLRLLLRQLKLSFWVKDGLLTIGSIEDAEAMAGGTTP
jgi:hypothetical protein